MRGRLATIGVIALLSTSGCAGVGGGGSGSASGLELPDQDAHRLAGLALEVWALGRSAVAYEVASCSRVDAATAECVTNVQFADNPVNPQNCSLAITVLATDLEIGVKEPTPADPTMDLESEGYALSNGGWGTYRYGDETGCDQAQEISGY
jgi:hypothetical protein